MLGLTNDLINILLDYVAISSRIGVVHSSVKEMGEHWIKKDILTIEKAIAYTRESLYDIDSSQ